MSVGSPRLVGACFSAGGRRRTLGSHGAVGRRVALSVLDPVGEVLQQRGRSSSGHDRCCVAAQPSVRRVQARLSSVEESGKRGGRVRCESLRAMTSNQARLPAEFKHITKRRKRN